MYIVHVFLKLAILKSAAKIVSEDFKLSCLRIGNEFS